MFYSSDNIVKFHEELHEGAILKNNHMSHMIVEKNCESHRFLDTYLLKLQLFSFYQVKYWMG